MNLYKWISLIPPVICLIIADIVYHSNKKALANKLFASTNCLIGWWAFTVFMCHQAGNLQIAQFWLKLGATMTTGGALFLHFCLVYTQQEKLLKKKLTYLILYIPPISFGILHLFTNLFSGPPLKKAWGYTSYSIPEGNQIAFFILNIWMLLLSISIFILLFRFFLKTNNPVKKVQVRYFTLGFLPLLLAGIVEIALNILKIEIPQISTIMLTWFYACIGQAIRKYELFALDPATAAENIISTIPDSLLLVNLYGSITRINRSYLVLSGYQERELTGRPFQELFKYNTEVDRIKTALMAGESFSNWDATLLLKSGGFIPALLSGSAISDKKKRVVGFVLVIRDITDRKKAEESLKDLAISLVRSNRELQDFAYIASHDLQEPLRKILVFGDYLKTAYADKLEDTGRDYILRMENAAVRMQSLISGLLNYSRVTTNAQPFTTVNLNRTIEEVLSDLEIRIKETGGKIEIESLPLIQADALQMRQLFQNLIGNALKYHKKGIPPVVTITGDVNGDSLEIKVKDNGIGFDTRYKEQIFGIFQRLVGKSEYEGTGIGLAICKKIAERHRGKIMADSIPGEGSTFLVTLPYSAAPASSAAIPGEA